MDVAIDRTRCMGSSMCEAEAPDVFAVDDDGVLHILVEQVGRGQLHAVTAAVERCPNEALKLIDA